LLKPWSLAVIISFEDAVKLGHPGGEHSFLAQPVDLWQRSVRRRMETTCSLKASAGRWTWRTDSTLPHSLFHIVLENFPKVMMRAGPGLDHPQHSLRAQKDFRIIVNSILECLIGSNLCIPFEKTLEKRREVRMMMEKLVLLAGRTSMRRGEVLLTWNRA